MKDILPGNGSPSTEELWQSVERFQEVKREATETRIGVVFEDGEKTYIVSDPKGAGCKVEPL